MLAPCCLSDDWRRQSGFDMFPRQEYRLTAPDGDLSSAQVLLNGNVCGNQRTVSND